jgi:hypothetical protein
MAAGPGTVSFTNAASPVTTASFSAEGMYELRLEASDGTLQSVDYVRVQVGPVTPPQAPGPLELVIRDADGPLVRASDRSLDEEGFTLQRRRSGETEWITVLEPGRNEPGGVDAGLEPGRFEYRMRAWNAAGSSSWSTGVLLHDVPPAVGDFAAERQVDPTRVGLSWTLDSEARIDQHWIYGRNEGEAEWTLLAKRAGRNTAYTDTKATAGVGRSYRIVSRNALGEGPEALVSPDVNEGATYEGWKDGYSWPLAGSELPLEDADGDGVINRFEYAFGSDPTDDGDQAVPVMSDADDTGLVLQYRVRKGAADIQYVPMRSPDLSAWDPVAVPGERTDADVDGDGKMELWQVRIPLPEGWTRQYGALSIEDVP